MKIKINDLFYQGQYQANMKVSTFNPFMCMGTLDKYESINFNPFMWSLTVDTTPLPKSDFGVNL